MLSPSQLAILKALAQADPFASQLMNGQDQELANWLNAESTFYVWRSVLTPELARAAIVQGAIQLDNLTVGKRDALLYITQGNLNVTDVAVRQSIDDLCGTQNTLKGALQSAERRLATRAEAALANGTGTMATPGLLGWEGWFDAGLASAVRS